jgi:GTPase
MFIDEITIHAQAGRGGDGVVRWRREKFIDMGGPNGGDGGRGGSIYAVAVQDINLLSKYKHKKEFKSFPGEAGMGGSKHGKDGADLIIQLPVGSVITSIESGGQISLEKEGQKELLLKGGMGGWGNEQFKTSVNTTPTKATKGKVGEQGHFKIELELFADIGLIGLPNAGKSSLLNAVTNAHAKIGSYQFTTLDPNLGDFYGHIIADIPGLIEGASEGKGLGFKFLRHIKRTNALLHLVSFENPDMMKTYKEIRNELKSYDKTLAEKEEVIVLTKTDMVDQKTIDKAIKQFEKTGNTVLALSLYDDKQVKAFMKELAKMLKGK